MSPLLHLILILLSVFFFLVFASLLVISSIWWSATRGKRNLARRFAPHLLRLHHAIVRMRSQL